MTTRGSDVKGNGKANEYPSPMLSATRCTRSSSEASCRSDVVSGDGLSAVPFPPQFGYQKAFFVRAALPQICVQLLSFCVVLSAALGFLWSGPGFFNTWVLRPFPKQISSPTTPDSNSDGTPPPAHQQADAKALLSRMSHILSVMEQNGAKFTVCKVPGIAPRHLKACMGQIRCEATRNWTAHPKVAESDFARVRFHQILSAVTSQVQAQGGNITPTEVMKSALQIRLQCEEFFYDEKEKTRMKAEMMEILGPILSHLTPPVMGGGAPM